MTAPTTRETADHAELAVELRAFEGSDDLGNGDFTVCEFAADALDALLSEIAALRGERDEWRETVRFSERCWSEERGVMIDRFTQAERQRDELRKALEGIASMAPSTCETSLAHDMAQFASQALANQGAE